MTKEEAKKIAADYKHFLNRDGTPKENMPADLHELGPEALMELQTPEEHAEHEKDAKHTEHPQSRVLQHLQDITQGSLGLFRKSQSLEEDSAYNKVQEQLKRNYLKNRNKKRFDLQDSKDLDFLYGSIDNPEQESVQSAAENIFREEAAKDPKKQKSLQRYDKNKAKIHGGFEKDPYVYQTKVKIAEHASLRQAALKKEYKKTEKKIDSAFDQDFKHVMERLKENSWKKFVVENPQKTAVYVAKESQKRAPARNATQSVAGGKKAVAQSHEEDDFAYLQKAYQTYRETSAQGQTRPTSTVLPQPFSGPTVHTITPPSSQQPPPISQILPTPPIPPLPSSPKTAEKHQEQQAVSPQPVNFQQGLTPQSSPTHPPVPKPPSQGMTRPPMQKVPLPPLTRRYIPSQGRTRPGGYSNPMVSLGRNFMQDRLSGMGKRLMGRIGSKVGQAAGNAGKQLAQKLAARALMNPVVLIVIGVILLIILIIIIIIMIITGMEDTTKQPTTIPGLTLSLVGPEPPQVNNGENIKYTINATYTGTAEVTLSDPLPTNTTFVSATGNFTNTNNTIAWKLNDPDLAANVASPSAGTTKSYSFTLILRPEKEDILVRNKIIANAIGGGSVPGGPVLTGGSGNACTAQYEGTGYCSVENLKQYFGGDAGKALVASMICQTESTSNPNSMNTNCRTNDYSVGLFQINLVAHCAGAYGGNSCNNLIDINKRNVCESQYKNPEENIKYMIKLSQNGTKWTDWSAYTSPSIGAKKRLAECGIN